MSFLRVLSDSFVLLRLTPKLFIPKILIAFFLLPMFILFGNYMVQLDFFSMDPSTLTRMQAVELLKIIVPLFFVSLYGMIVDLIDIFIVNPMYPIIVRDYLDMVNKDKAKRGYKDKAKGISFSKALVSVLEKYGTIFPALATVMLIIFVVMMPVAWLFSIALFLHNPFIIGISLAAMGLSVFILFVLFYLIYPISSLEEFNFLKLLKQTVRVSTKHKGNVAKAFLVFLPVPLVSYALSLVIAWLRQSGDVLPMLLIFGAFVVMRLLVAILSTYQYVLNTVFYLGLEKGIFLKK